MGSGCETAQETVDYLSAQGDNVGVLKVRLYRPWDIEKLLAAFPKTVKKIAVLDRTKEPGAGGEPLYLDVVSAFSEAWEGTMPKIVGGRYGLSSKEFNPPMVKAVFDNLSQDKPKNHFTIGIHDDLTQTSLPYDDSFSTEPDEVSRSIFYGLGSDGTVGANKNSIKIIGSATDNYAQGYFVYDSKKSGAVTVSHLRFGPEAIRSTYLINQANFVGCHQWTFLEKLNVLKAAAPGATFLLNSPYSPEEVWDRLPPRNSRTDCPQKPEILRHKRPTSGAGQWHGGTHQYRDANLLLCPLRCLTSGPGDRRNQKSHRENLWQKRTSRCPDEPQRR